MKLYPQAPKVTCSIWYPQRSVGTQWPHRHKCIFTRVICVHQQLTCQGCARAAVTCLVGLLGFSMKTFRSFWAFPVLALYPLSILAVWGLDRLGLK